VRGEPAAAAAASATQGRLPAPSPPSTPPQADLFAEKLAAGVDIRDDAGAVPRFLDYAGGCDARQALQYLRDRFTEHNRRVDAASCRLHVTCATDSTAMRVVFDAITDSLLKRNLASLEM